MIDWMHNPDLINFSLAMSLIFVVLWFVVWIGEKILYRLLTKRINERESDDNPVGKLPES